MPYEVKNVRKAIPSWIQNLLWARAAGRCEFEGCNRPLWKSLVTQRTGNKADKAHIWSVGERGPTRKGKKPESIDSVENLILLCFECHHEIDAENNVDDYPSSTLLRMKKDHEDRTQLVTSLVPSLKSHVLLFGANIGDYSSLLRFEAVAPAMLPHRFPAEKEAIQLGLMNSCAVDHDPSFWAGEVRNLCGLFERRVRDRLATERIDHISVFARAPQPLLIGLGVLLTDIPDVDVYPLRREPPGFGFEDAPDLELKVRPPARSDGPPALVFSLSATVVPSRIHRVLGSRASLWTVTVPSPHNDLVRSRGHLSQFRQAMRRLLDRIKAKHGEDTRLHVFPAMPIPLNVELGRVRMPKADMPWRLYDEIPGDGFVPAVDVDGGRIAAHLAKEDAA